MKSKKISGLIMVIIGFILILINAAGYIFGWDITSPVLAIMGLVFVTIGMQTTKKEK